MREASVVVRVGYGKVNRRDPSVYFTPAGITAVPTAPPPPVLPPPVLPTLCCQPRAVKPRAANPVLPTRAVNSVQRLLEGFFTAS